MKTVPDARQMQKTKQKGAISHPNYMEKFLFFYRREAQKRWIRVHASSRRSVDVA